MYHAIGIESTNLYAFLYNNIKGIFCKQIPNTYFMEEKSWMLKNSKQSVSGSATSWPACKGSTFKGPFTELLRVN